MTAGARGAWCEWWRNALKRRSRKLAEAGVEKLKTMARHATPSAERDKPPPPRYNIIASALFERGKTTFLRTESCASRAFAMRVKGAPCHMAGRRAASRAFAAKNNKE